MKKILFLLLVIPLVLPAQTKYVFGVIKSGGTPGPTITRSPSSLTGFSTTEGTASAYQTATIGGSNLTGDIAVSGTTHWETSLSAGSGYTGSTTLTESGGSVSGTTVYFRIKSTATAGTYTETCNITSPGVTQHITLTGTVDAAGGTTRILIDLGGTTSPVFECCVKTPTDAAGTTGVDSSGRYWNNSKGYHTPNYNWINGLVDTAGNSIAITISGDKSTAGTFATTDSGISVGPANISAPVGDYPWSAVSDCMYFHSSAGVVTWTVHVPAGHTIDSISFWGTRNATGNSRNIEITKNSDGATMKTYNAYQNSNYATRATLYNLSDGDLIKLNVKSGDTFGHVSVIDITYH